MSKKRPLAFLTAFAALTFFGLLPLTAGDALILRCDWFDRGNLIPGASYADTLPCALHHGGPEEDRAEYDVTIPQKGKYAVSCLVAAEESRPVDFALDETLVIPNVLGETTGSWKTSSAAWRKIVETELDAGKHTIRLSRSKCVPHLCALKIEPLFELGESWSVPRETAKTKCSESAAVDDPNSLPWNVGWFNEVSFDRRKKGESGGVFTDHFAAESAVALLAPEAVAWETAPAGNDPASPNVNLLDELTYRPSMFSKAEETEPTAEIFVRARLTESAPADGPLPDGTVFTLSPERYRRLLEKTLALLDRLENHFGADELAERGMTAEKVERIRRHALDEQKTIDARTAAVIAEKRGEAEGAGAGKNLTDAFFAAIRDYSELARSNPLLDFDRLLFVRRSTKDLGLMQNWMSNSVLNVDGFQDSLRALDLRGDAGGGRPTAREFFTPDYPTFLGDLDLDFDGKKLLVSSIHRDKTWNLFDLDLEKIAALGPAEATAKSAELMTPEIPAMAEANHYDGCHLPDGSMIYTSSACYISVPCVNGYTRVTNTYRKYADGSIRRLTFDQEHNWCPTVMPDGRILYLRWEYTDTPHAHARLLFLMNPDGTNQTAFYGSNSYWPNSMFYARPIPDAPSKFVAVVTGHHGVTRMGELVLFDVSKGRKETSGAVMRICGKEKKVASKTDPKYDDTLIVDNLVDEAWPKFLHPYPLSEDDFLVAAQPAPGALWGIYLVDSDDNMTLLSQEPGFAYFEPTPLIEREKPPMPAERVDLSRTDATVFLADIYEGAGLKNVPRGTVKNLRLITYNYLFPNMGGPQGTVGAEGPWDIKRVIGVVPVEESGAALFTIPANTPIALQPLDENGKALQLMRSWLTAMPGETLSCIGCHEDANSVSPSSFNPSDMSKLTQRSIEPWHGPERGFSFQREVQPVLDRYCIACHNGETQKEGKPIVDLRGLERITDYSSAYHSGTKAGRFSTSYAELHRYVRRPGMESDYHLLMPTEFSAETTDLYKLLVKGHYQVRLDAESWDRLLTWIDLNAPYYGTWTEQAETDAVAHWNERRKTILELYTGVAPNQETIPPAAFDPEKAGASLSTPWNILPRNPFGDTRLAELIELAKKGTPFPSGEALAANLNAPIPAPLTIPDWPFNLEKAEARQKSAAKNLSGDESKVEEKIELAEGVYLTLRLIPAGEFVAGAQSLDSTGSVFQRSPDETARVEKIERPFWIASLETTNRQYELFDPSHDAGVESRYAMQFGVRGFYVNAPERSAVRVSWNKAENFCRWLSEKTGKKFRLPTDSEWEWAARAGTATPFWYGGLDDDFSPFENLCDATMKEFVCHPYFKERKPLGGTKYDHWLPRDDRFNDGGFLSEAPGKYRPNPWGLFDVHGNAAEWTGTDVAGQKIVRGGSWHDRPQNARSEYRTFYQPWQGVYNVGFRVVCEAE